MNAVLNRSHGFLSVVTLLGFLLSSATGCVEQSIVVKVRNDGSALLHVRSSAMPVPFTKVSDVDENQKGVHQSLLDELLKTLGPGVSVKSNESFANSRGWPGTDLVLHCEDVHSLKITKQTLGLLLSFCSNKPDQKMTDGDNKEDEYGDFEMGFNLKERQLSIDLNFQLPDSKAIDRDQTQDPFGNAPPSSPFVATIGANAIRHVRMGLFVETEDAISKSDATQPIVNETLITIFELDGSRIDANKYYDLLRKKPKRSEEYKALVDEMEGLSVEWKPRVLVELK